ncbi:MAG: hypothetical protein KAV87_68155 [Desulfobacteraceae bacterium]|nr:hypothetical protein [Desulfobacteraceae bacterium]
MKYPLLRISYWAGAIVDGVAAMAMIFPALGKKMFGLANFNPGPDYSFAMGMSASLMLGWTALLIWADRDPLARKGILLLTVFPVIFGIVIAEIIVVASGLIAVGQMIPLWIMQVSLSILFIFSYWKTK